jgi:hypothetical protein
MNTAKWTSLQERSRIHAILLQDLMKRGCLQVWGGDALTKMFDIVVCKETQSKADLYSFQGQKSSTKILYINNELVDGSCVRARSKAIFFSPLQICK